VAGFGKPFVEKALLPDWWDEACATDISVLPELEFRVSRFLGVALSDVRDPTVPLFAPTVAGARLRHTKDIDPERLLASVHAGLEVARATARAVQDRAVRLPPTDPTDWRAELVSGGALALERMVADLWDRGIPVLRVTELPAPKYQGMACVVEGRPIIVLGRAHDEPHRLAFLVAHEVGHIVHGDCEPDRPVVDEEERVDSSDMEIRADAYAWKVLTGGAEIPMLTGTDPRGLAQQASDLEMETKIDAGFIVWAWANKTGAFQTGAMALKALYLHRGGGQVLTRHAQKNLDLDSASETDRSLLACIDGVGVGGDAAPG
jgi:hypothetical protein